MEDFLADYKTSDLFQASRLYTRRYARTFYFASFVLPRPKRNAAYIIYAFCRYADNIVDESSHQKGTGNVSLPLTSLYPMGCQGLHSRVLPVPFLIRRLDRLRSELDKLYSGAGGLSSKLEAFSQIVRRYEIPKEHFSALLDGVEMDLTVFKYQTWEELEVYCYRVASAVGLIMARIFGVASDAAYPYAIQLGKAMQLTNILRDVKEDFERGRVYLPLEELARFDCSEVTLKEENLSQEFIEFMKFEISRARALYRSADAGILMLTDTGSRFCVRVMSSLYERILDVIERNHYDVFGRRATVPFLEKVACLVRLKVRNKDSGRPARISEPLVKSGSKDSRDNP